MYLAVSNIAWGSHDFDGFLGLLERLGCHGVELAPSLNWDEPVEASTAQRKEIKNKIVDNGLVLVGLHSLFYTRPDLTLFGDAGTRWRMADYCKKLMYLCRDLGGKILVFGSPKNRRREEMDLSHAMDIAVDLFRDLAGVADECGVFLCIEPLDRKESDFITSSHEGMELVLRVNHPNVRLHLDAKSMISSKEDYKKAFQDYSSFLRHFHVGDPGLAPPGSAVSDHEGIGKALRASGYKDFVSIEMRRDFGPPPEVIKQSISYVMRCYLGNNKTE